SFDATHEAVSFAVTYRSERSAEVVLDTVEGCVGAVERSSAIVCSDPPVQDAELLVHGVEEASQVGVDLSSHEQPFIANDERPLLPQRRDRPGRFRYAR